MSVRPAVSVARSATVYVPGVAYVKVAVGPAASLNRPLPSRSHTRLAIAPSTSCAVDVNVTGRPAVGDALTSNEAIGGPPTGMVIAAIAVAPRLSVTSRRTIASPDCVNTRCAVGPVASENRPLPVRSHANVSVLTFASGSVEVDVNVTA